MQDTANPYRPPESDVALPPSAALADASRLQRFLTLVVDYVGFMLAGFVIGLVLAVAGVGEVVQQVPELLFGVVVVSLYYAFFEGLFDRTPGKWLCGTRVVAEGGGRPAAGQLVKRTLARFIPFEAFSFFGARGWHDSLSKTRVVRTR